MTWLSVSVWAVKICGMAVACIVGMLAARRFAGFWAKLALSFVAVIVGVGVYVAIGMAAANVVSSYGLVVYQGAFPDDAGSVLARAIGHEILGSVVTAVVGAYLGVWRAPKIFKWHVDSSN